MQAIQGKRIDLYIKASCIKDNRTKLENFRGVGFASGLDYLQDIRKHYGVKVTTDFHSYEELREYATAVDLIQIPAYLAQQTSLLTAASTYKRDIHIKKPPFLSPQNASLLVHKISSTFENKVFLTDRGTSFGYDQLMMDPRHIALLEADKVLADVTHPNKWFPGDAQDNALILAKTALVSGADGIFVETAINATSAKCDSSTMLTPKNFTNLVEETYDLWSYLNDK